MIIIVKMNYNPTKDTLVPFTVSGLGLMENSVPVVLKLQHVPGLAGGLVKNLCLHPEVCT